MRYSAEERLDDLLAIGNAKSHSELQHHLALRPPAATDLEPSVPVSVFRTVHEAGPDGAIDTFVLMATDSRWKPIAHELIVALVDTDLLSGDDLDLVAEAFVAGDRWVYWECPDEWFSDEITIELPGWLDDDLDDPDDPDGSGAADEPPGEDDGPTLARRDLPRGARRWAADRLVRQEPGRWAALLARARELPSKVGAPILLGLMDAASCLPDDAARFIDRRAAESGDVAVRLAALRRLASYDAEAALALGLADRNGRVRAWARSETDPTGPVPSEPDEVQGSLF